MFLYNVLWQNKTSFMIQNVQKETGAQTSLRNDEKKFSNVHSPIAVQQSWRLCNRKHLWQKRQESALVKVRRIDYWLPYVPDQLRITLCHSGTGIKTNNYYFKSLWSLWKHQAGVQINIITDLHCAENKFKAEEKQKNEFETDRLG